jgi:hypothetical protein
MVLNLSAENSLEVGKVFAGDTLTFPPDQAGPRFWHRGMLLRLAKTLWPRWLLKRVFKNHGLALLIEARK